MQPCDCSQGKARPTLRQTSKTAGYDLLTNAGNIDRHSRAVSMHRTAIGVATDQCEVADGMTDAHAHLHLPRVSTTQSAQGCRLFRCTGDGTPSLCAAMLAKLSSIPSKRHVPIYLHVHTHAHVIVRLAREQSSEDPLCCELAHWPQASLVRVMHYSASKYFDIKAYYIKYESLIRASSRHGPGGAAPR